MTDFRTLLQRETAHFGRADRDGVAWLLRQAEDLARAFPSASCDALADKLLTLCPVDRWVRVLVAKAALQPREIASPAALAA